MRERMPIPDSIAGAPKLRPGLEHYWEAFDDLSTERAPPGWGPPGRIPWTAIHRYAMAHGYHGDAYLDLKEVVKAMDEAFMSHCEKDMERQREQDRIARMEQQGGGGG